MDPASVSLLVSAAATLAAEAPEAAEARWDALAGDDDAIDAEIAKYRAALSALSQRLRELGGFEPTSRGGSDDGEAAANGGAGGAAGGGAGGGTIEGVDVSRFGFVIELSSTFSGSSRSRRAMRGRLRRGKLAIESN